MRNVRWVLGVLWLGWGSLAGADRAYQLRVEAPSAAKGTRSVAKVIIAPGPGFHINKEFPTSMTVNPPDGVKLEKPKQSGKDAVRLEEAGAEFDVGYVASSAGDKPFSGELKFAVCTATTCDPKKEKLSFVVQVK